MRTSARSFWLLLTAMGLVRCSSERSRGTEPEDLAVDSNVERCPVITALSALPGETLLGSSVELRVTLSAPSEVRWSGVGGTLADPALPLTLFTCEVAGPHVITVRLHGVGANCAGMSSVDILCTKTLPLDAGTSDAGALDASTDAAVDASAAADAGA